MSAYTTVTVGGVSFPQIEKDVDDILDYPLSFATWLADIEDTIDSATVIVPTGITLFDTEYTTTHVIGWLSGGTAGVIYPVVYRIVTAGGRTKDQTIRVKIVER